MILTYYLQFLPKVILIGKLSGLIPIEYNEHTRRVSYTKNARRKLIYRLSLLFTSFYSFSMIIRMVTRSYEFSRTMVGIGYIVVMAGASVLRWNWNLDNKYINFINAMIIWEKQNPPSKIQIFSKVYII